MSAVLKAVRPEPRPKDRVFLTFDDGPDPDWTPRILDILSAAGVRATFFAIGRSARAHPALVRRISAAGHELGNHTFSHRHPFVLRQRHARSEVADGAKALADIIGRPVLYFRPPHGRVRRCMVEEAEAHGQTLVLWNLSAIDWGCLGSAEGIARRLRQAAPGDIVLMHDGCRDINRTAELVKALPGFFVELRRRRLKPDLLPR